MKTPASLSGMRVLVVDDDQASALELAGLLQAWNFTVETAPDGRVALEKVPHFLPDIFITDLVMPGMDGFEFMARLTAEGHRLPVIVLTAFGNIELGLRAIHQLGAFWFLEKPVRAEGLRFLVSRAAEQVQLTREEERLRRQLAYSGMLVDLAGTCPAMQSVFSLIQQVAPTSAAVLITGESGTGKELAAQAIHHLSPRADGPFVAVNCAALPEELIESELFGHEKGAFTGAVERRAGCFERADGGTILLDELAEMPAHLQATLLRVLEDSHVRPLGGKAEIPVDVRVIASTNRDPAAAISNGKLREDLFYRLSVFHLHMPALRERAGDIPLLTDVLIAGLNARHRCQVTGIEERTLRLLEEHRWPGNVRELRNVLERAVIVAQKGALQMGHLPPDFLRPGAPAVEPGETEASVRLSVGTKLADLEKALIHLTLAHASNDKTRAARMLGISRKTMFNRLKAYREEQDSHRASA